MANPQGLREAISRAVDFVRGGPIAKKQQSRTSPPDPSWVGIRLAATWVMGLIPQGTLVDGTDQRLQQAAAILLGWAKEGRVELLEFDDGPILGLTHYFRRAQIEALMLKNAVPLTLSRDSSGGFVNRGADGEFPKAKDPIVVVRGTQQRTEIASDAIPMPSPFGPRGGKVPEASSGPYDPGWQ
jgi:hypothetical protein